MKLALNWRAIATLAGACAILWTEIGATEKSDAGVAAGRWTSNDNVAMAGTAKAGAKFFLDIVVARDGSKPEAASGRLETSLNPRSN